MRESRLVKRDTSRHGGGSTEWNAHHDREAHRRGYVSGRGALRLQDEMRDMPRDEDRVAV